MPRVPGFIGPSYADLTRPVDAQETINLFTEKVESGHGANDLILRKIPGRAPFAYLSDGPIRGCFAMNGRCFVAAGVSLFEVFDGLVIATWRRIGTIAADDFDASFASNGAGGNQLFIVSGGIGYICFITPGTTPVLARIGSAFPANARRACFLDGYFLTMSGIFVYASALEDGTVWSAASKAQRSIAADDLVSIVVDDHRVLWLIGDRTSEPWYNAGQTPFAFAPVQNSFVGQGTAARDSVTRFDNTVFALGQSENGDRYAFIISNGQAAQRISTHAIENVWRGYRRVTDAKAWTYAEMGHSFVVLTFPSADATWVYDASTQMWHRRGLWNRATARYEADLGSCHCFAFNRHLVGSRVGSDLFEQTLSLYTDNANQIRWVRRAPHLAKERTWLYFDSFELIAEVGQGDIVPVHDDIGAVDPLVSLSFSDDGGYTWSAERERALGKMGQYGTRPIWNRLGRSLDRVFQVVGSGTVKTTLIDAIVKVR